MHRRRRTAALVGAALAGAALAPAAAHAQFPVYPKDKWLGSISEFTRPLFLQYFNQVTPENGGKWGVAAGTTRTAAMRWGQLDTAYNYAVANDMKFNFHVLLWGNQQPTWMATLPPEEQLVEIIQEPPTDERPLATIYVKSLAIGDLSEIELSAEFDQNDEAGHPTA